MIGGYGYKVFFRAIDDNATDISAYEHCAQMGVCSKERKVIDESGYFICKLTLSCYIAGLEIGMLPLANCLSPIES